jgi:hypothetical protein
MKVTIYDTSRLEQWYCFWHCIVLYVLEIMKWNCVFRFCGTNSAFISIHTSPNL